MLAVIVKEKTIYPMKFCDIRGEAFHAQVPPRSKGTLSRDEYNGLTLCI